MELVVLGASGPTGLHVLRQALDAGHRVRAVTRHPDRLALRDPDLTAVRGDVHDPDDVHRALAGAQAVVSTYGVPYSRHPVTVYSRGIGHVLDAMAAHGVDRLVCVSSTTVAREPAPSESWWWSRGVEPFLRRVVGRTLYDDMERMEAAVRASDVSWTIVRPAGLFDADAPSEDAEVGPSRLQGHLTSRPDLARVLLAEATEPRHPRTTIDVVTRSGHPSPWHFLREVRGKR